MIRGFEEQFEKDRIDQIRRLLQRIDSFSLPKGVSHYYAVDLSLCLQAGALLGALQVAASLLEIFVRETVVEQVSKTYPDSERVSGSFQEKLEQKRNVGFKQLVVELSNAGIISTTDAQIASQFYDDVRIPIHHGLPARFVNNSNDYKSFLESLLGYTQQVVDRDFEEVIEDEALTLIETAITIIELIAKGIDA